MLIEKTRVALTALGRHFKSVSSNSASKIEEKPTRIESLQQPLRFLYLYSGGKLKKVELHDWVEDGAFVEGQRRSATIRESFMKLRMWEWQDTSYRQLTGYNPRKGAPVK